jgi:hypothetical protein
MSLSYEMSYGSMSEIFVFFQPSAGFSLLSAAFRGADRRFTALRDALRE